MDVSKGLHRDSDPVNQPKSTYPYGRNGILGDVPGSVINEPGFTEGAPVPGTVLGVIATDSKPVFFCLGTTPGKLYIYYYNTISREFTGILGPDGLSGSPDDYTADDLITGEWERNYKGELVVAFTDNKPGHRPMYLNCDTPGITVWSDLYLVPLLTVPFGFPSARSGGSLRRGQYIPYVSYERTDGAKTHYIQAGPGVVIPSTDDGAISLRLTGVDQRYQFLRVGFIYRSGGETRSYYLDATPITGTEMTVDITGGELTYTIPVAEMLIAPPDYSRVAAMTQVEGELYLGNLETDDEIDYQPWALAVKVWWQSQNMNLQDVSPEHASGVLRGMMHQEVYAIYIRLWTTSGRPTRWFHIPGRDPVSDELSFGTYDDVTDTRKFRVRDTINGWVFDPATRGYTGIWLNETELYPNHPSFTNINPVDGGTIIGGRDYRAQAVRHHRMPSMNWLKQNIYPDNDAYGKTNLDLLGLFVENVQIPPHLEDKITHWEIGYAVRSVNNATVLGYAPLLHPAMKNDDRYTNQDNGNQYSSGGNWESGSFLNGGWDYMRVNEKGFRLHPFEMLIFRPQARPWALSRQFEMTVPVVQLEDGKIGSEAVGSIERLDYVNPASHTWPFTMNAFAVQPGTAQYVEHDQVSGVWINTKLETAMVGKLKTTRPMRTSALITRSSSDGFITVAATYSKPAPLETIDFVSILADRTDVYESFMSQQIVPTGQRCSVSLGSDVIFKGDSYVGLYTYHTYGDFRPGQSTDTQGIRAVRRIAVPTSANIHQRYEDTANLYSRFWPKSALVNGDPNNYLIKFLLSQDPNQFGYDKDFSSLVTFDPGVAFSIFSEIQQEFPYRVHRYGRMGSDRTRSWRNALPLDYYDIRRNKGVIVGLASDGDKLLIHTENALLSTVGKGRLSAGDLSVILGTGDIFQFEPQESVRAPLGYAGLQNRRSALNSVVGYSFIDEKARSIYLYSGGRLEDITPGLSQDMREHLFTTDAPPILGYDPMYKRLLLTVRSNDLRDTISWSVRNQAWAFFHDYLPDWYVNLRDKLLTVNAGRVFHHRAQGEPAERHGSYYYESLPGIPVHSFFIDIAIPFGEEKALNAIQWLVDNPVLSNLTHVTIWNSQQCTGRTPVLGYRPLLLGNARNTKGYWSLDKIRGKATTYPFMSGISQYMQVLPGTTEPLPWFKSPLLEDNYVIVRLEYDNLVDAQVRLQDLVVDTSKATR